MNDINKLLRYMEVITLMFTRFYKVHDTLMKLSFPIAVNDNEVKLHRNDILVIYFHSIYDVVIAYCLDDTCSIRINGVLPSTSIISPVISRINVAKEVRSVVDELSKRVRDVKMNPPPSILVDTVSKLVSTARKIRSKLTSKYKVMFEYSTVDGITVMTIIYDGLPYILDLTSNKRHDMILASPIKHTSSYYMFAYSTYTVATPGISLVERDLKTLEHLLVKSYSALEYVTKLLDVLLEYLEENIDSKNPFVRELIKQILSVR